MQFQFNQNIRHGIFWIGSLKTLGQILIWINTIIIARFLDPSDYGLAGMAHLVTSFILLIGSFGFDASIIQKKDLQKVQAYSLFWITFLIGLVFAALVYGTAPMASRFFDNTRLTSLLQLSAVALFFGIISEIPYSLLIKDLRYKRAGFVDLFSALFASILILACAIRGLGAYSLILGSIALGFLKLLLSCALNQWLPRSQFQWHGLKRFLRFGNAIVISRILWYLYDNADYLILAKKLGQIPFGIYSFAFNLASTPTSKIQPIISPVLYSSFAMIQDDPLQSREKFLKIIRVAFACYAMVYCGLFWVSREFVTLFLGAKWLPMVLVLQILLTIQPLRAISSPSPSLINALGKPGVGAWNTFILLIIMVPSFLFGSRWGMVGVSLMWCLVYPVAFIITLQRYMRAAQIPLSRYLLNLLPGARLAAIASIVLYAYSMLVPHLFFATESSHMWGSFIGKVILGTLSYALTLLFFDRALIKMAIDFVRR